MKRTVALILVVLSIFTLVSCGKKADENTFDVDDALERSVRANVSTYCMFNFKDVKNTLVDITDTDVSGNLYAVKGKVTVIDDYGDRYVGKFDGVFELNGESFTEKSLEVETPKKES